MSTFNPNTALLTPPSEEEEIYPYRRVWRSIIFGLGVLGAVAVGLFIMIGFIGIRLPDTATPFVNLGLTLLPLASWIVFVFIPERQAPQPRVQIVAVVVVCMLVTNAVYLPVIQEFFRVGEWLPLADAFTRIAGHTATTGALQTTMIYIILRVMLWPHHLRIRLDPIAYAESIAVGFTVVNGLHFITEGVPPADVTASFVLRIYVFNLAAGLITAYGLSRMRFDQPGLLLMPFVSIAAALAVGIAVPFHAGLLSASFSPEGITAPRPLFSLGFTIGFGAVILLVTIFLMDNAQRAAEQRTGLAEVEMAGIGT